jgi:hypothetical protein
LKQNPTPFRVGYWDAFKAPVIFLPGVFFD